MPTMHAGASSHTSRVRVSARGVLVRGAVRAAAVPATADCWTTAPPRFRRAAFPISPEAIAWQDLVQIASARPMARGRVAGRWGERSLVAGRWFGQWIVDRGQ